jgi:hypothetical protein
LMLAGWAAEQRRTRNPVAPQAGVAADEEDEGGAGMGVDEGGGPARTRPGKRGPLGGRLGSEAASSGRGCDVDSKAGWGSGLGQRCRDSPYSATKCTGRFACERRSRLLTLVALAALCTLASKRDA